ncbi:putative transposase for IS2404 [Mycobacterium ulcerans str. Harvey]|uniref:Transposase for IS2404 n=1 Tax=Mycobacterium ulcerans str. Harvey TaxID=1299332 RepID=A0ABP3AHM6_MYCUL|nr:putative transposase for IS2404 [Mycobacterium ulcerans str. Harvey]
MSRLDPATSTPGWAVTSLHTWPAATPVMVPIALDGKMLRGALRAKATATHLVSVFAHRARLVLGQLAVAEKSNEIPCVRALLTLLPDNLRWLVTVDAMHTQVVTAKLICATLKSQLPDDRQVQPSQNTCRITALPGPRCPQRYRRLPRPRRVKTRTCNHHRCTRSASPTQNKSSGSLVNARSPHTTSAA